MQSHSESLKRQDDFININMDNTEKFLYIVLIPLVGNGSVRMLNRKYFLSFYVQKI